MEGVIILGEQSLVLVSNEFLGNQTADIAILVKSTMMVPGLLIAYIL